MQNTNFYLTLIESSKFSCKSKSAATYELAKFKLEFNKCSDNNLPLPPFPEGLEYNAVAKINDFQSDPGGILRGFYITDLALDFLQKFDLPNYKIIPVTYSLFGRKNYCNYIFFYKKLRTEISIEDCTFKVMYNLPGLDLEVVRDLKFSSIEEYKAYELPDPRGVQHRVLQDLVITDPEFFNHDIFIIDYGITGAGIYFSERLMKDIQLSGLTGVSYDFSKRIESFRVVGIKPI